jgi:hypothetical protein
VGVGRVEADESADLFEAALRIISNGSFPRPGHRETLPDGERRQLRDAMIFVAHARERRDVLVTTDTKGVVNGGRRAKLEALGQTLIRTPDELESVFGDSREDDSFSR